MHDVPKPEKNETKEKSLLTELSLGRKGVFGITQVVVVHEMIILAL